MRVHVLSAPHRIHSGSSLSARGGALRTFGSLAVFAVLVMLSLGGYLIADQFENPIQAQSATLLLAALLIATAATLICPLLAATRKIRSTPGGKRP